MKRGTFQKLLLYAGIPLLSCALHGHIFTRDLVGFHVWRQSQTQINVQNFVSEDLNILNPRIDDRGDGDGIHRMEFPLMQWLFALVLLALGDDIFWIRAMSFLIGCGSIFGMYHLIRAVFTDHRHALPGAWAFAFSPLLYYYIVNPMPDNFALLCSVWGMVFFFRYIRSASLKDAAFSAALIGLAVLAKLPFAACTAGIAAFFLTRTVRHGREFRKEIVLPSLLYLGFLLPAAAWYVRVIPGWKGNGIVRGILDSGLPAGELLNIARFNLTSSLPELLINYGSVAFFIAGVVTMIRGGYHRRPGFVALAGWGGALLAYFLFEMNMIRYVHDYYLLPFLPPVFLIVYPGIRRLMASERKGVRVAATVFLTLLPLTAFLRINHRWNLEAPGLNRDLLVHKAELRAAVPDDALCVLGNDESRNIFFYYVNKKGWGFDGDRLGGDTLRSMIDRGARYLYSDSRAVDGDASVAPLLEGLVLERGSIRIYRLVSPGGPAGASNPQETVHLRKRPPVFWMIGGNYLYLARNFVQ